VPQPDFVTAAAAAAGAAVGGSHPTAAMRILLRWSCRNVLRQLGDAACDEGFTPALSQRAESSTCGCRYEGRPR